VCVRVCVCVCVCDVPDKILGKDAVCTPYIHGSGQT
jgi:hypothetical protein